MALWGRLGYSLLLSFLLVSYPFNLKSADLDRDGIDEALEEYLAKSFMPWIWYWSHESCPEPGVILYHVRPYAPGGSTDTLSVTYSVSYYDDCGINGHEFDIESFAVTLYPVGTSPSGFGVHSLTTWAHLGSECETSDTRYYNPPAPDLGNPTDTIYTAWEEVWVSDDKHGFFLSEGDCDPECFFSDECESERVMNDGRLVSPENGQFFYLFNIGEMNDPLIENFTEINEVGGFTFESRSIWGGNLSERHYLASPGPSYPVGFEISTFPFPNPVVKCQDNSIGIELWYRSFVWTEIYDGLGQHISDRYLGELCPGNDVRFKIWSGRDGLGNCLANGPMIARIVAMRGTDTYETNVSFNNLGDPIPKPSSPSNLNLSLVDDHIRLTWSDNSNNENWFQIERREGTCGFVYFTTVGAHAGTGTVQYEDHDIRDGETYSYRLFAVGDGGFSSLSNERDIAIPECLQDPQRILSGPTLNSDTIYESRSYTATIEVGDSECPLVDYEWTVYGNQWTDPGTIYGTGNSVIYVAPDVDCDRSDYPAFQNKIDVRVTYQGYSESASTGWFVIVCQPPDTGGCPTLHVWDGDRFAVDNNLLPLSEIGTGNVTDYCLLTAKPVPWDGRYVLEIREDGKERSFIDAIELLCIDHPSQVHIGVTAEGRIFGYEAIDPPESARRRDGRSFMNELDRIDGAAFRGVAGDEVVVRFDRPGSGIFALNLSPSDPELKSFGPAVRIIPNDAGEVPGGPYGIGMGLPRHKGGLQFLDASSLHEPSQAVELALSWIDPVGLDFIGEVAGLTHDIHPERLSLKDAQHVTDGDIRNRLLKADHIYADLKSSEKIRLGIFAPESVEGLDRDFILKVQGYYTRSER